MKLALNRKVCIALICLTFIFIIQGLIRTAVAAEGNEVIDISDRRELFVDTLLIDKLINTRLQLHHPQREGVALEFDKPWEGPFSAYPTILNDDNIYRMYYRGLPNTKKSENYHPAVVCYAESRDGVVWTKPNLRIHEILGSKDNNVILSEPKFSHNFCPFIDRKPGVPENERYKAIASIEQKGLYGFISPDGIHWRKIQSEPIFTQGMFDSQNVVFWSESEQLYICYYRIWTGEHFTGFRTIGRTTSGDFLRWSAPDTMTYGDAPMEHLYTNATKPYYRAPHIYLSFPKRFFPDKTALPANISESLVDNPKYRFASSDAVFMSTRGGNQYDRTFMEGFIRPGVDERDWVARDNTPALGLIEANSRELYLYRMSHYAQPTAHIARYSLRIDGFASVSAPYEGGELLTKPFTFKGKQLEINYATSAAGSIQVEIQDTKGNTIPGFSTADCLLIFGDEISRIVEWQSDVILEALSGKPVRLRFVMKDADLYSLCFK